MASSPPLPEATKSARSKGSRANASYLGQRSEIHEAPEYPQAEAVEYVVRVVYPPAGLRHEEALGLPHAVPVHGEVLAGLLSSR